VEGIRYIPGLAESIYSLFLHINVLNMGSIPDGLYVIYPEFKTKALLGTDNIYLDAVPVHKAIVSNTNTSEPSSTFVLIVHLILMYFVIM
jgi:hypothetical protein